ncbi:Tir chaperone family protein [Rhizobium sp. PDO1-076]|uniref:type III secretion system chaperone n=1 Tax=Rhizobium sp. PDO1-076 TaxID=1125979 RepID=UPI00024E3460|nr:type III secretion system chaperone [Rhizobium sp. PDO1-076]EHS50837.1 Tir chaperone family protein [Rhizobium sp. PDO1-076]
MSDNLDDARRHASRLLEDFGATAGIEDIAFNQAGRCDLAFDDQPMTISFDEDTGDMCIESPVLDIPPSPAWDFYGWVLEDNFLSFVNGAGCLAIDRSRGKIVWLDRRPVSGLSKSIFDRWLSLSIERVEYWVKNLVDRANSAELAKPDNTRFSNDTAIVFRP